MRSEKTTRTLNFAADMVENKGRRVAWGLWKEAAAAHRVAVLLGADGGKSFARRATRGAVHVLAENARRLLLAQSAGPKLQQSKLWAGYCTWQKTARCQLLAESAALKLTQGKLYMGLSMAGERASNASGRVCRR